MSTLVNDSALRLRHRFCVAVIKRRTSASYDVAYRSLNQTSENNRAMEVIAHSDYFVGPVRFSSTADRAPRTIMIDPAPPGVYRVTRRSERIGRADPRADLL